MGGTTRVVAVSVLTADTQSGSGSASITSSFNNNGEIATTNGGGPQNGTYGHDTTGSDAGQLNSITSGANVTSFGYNGQGDTTSCSATSGTPCSSAGSATYTFDEENRLIKETDSLKGPETMLYDGNGLLQQEKETIPGPCPAIVKGAVKRHAPAPMTASPSLSCLYTDQLTWSTALGDPTLASTHTWSSSLDLGTTDYVMGPDGSPVEQLTTVGSSTTPEWYYADFQGNTRVLMDASGSPQVTYNYPAWGATTDWVGTGNGTPLQYNATFTDQWTGLVYDQARWYDPSTGQFVSQDPMVDQTLQPYAYASGAPVVNGDPSGTYSYRYRETVGTARQTHGPARVMHYLQRHLRSMFPFPTGSCSRVVQGRTCVLRPFVNWPKWAFLVLGGILGAAACGLFVNPLCVAGGVAVAYGVYRYLSDPVRVTRETKTSFTFKVLGGPIGEGDWIRFSTGWGPRHRVWLEERAHAPHAAWWLDQVTDHFHVEKGAWNTLAGNLRRHFAGSR